jgi:hypothetical protein
MTCGRLHSVVSSATLLLLVCSSPSLCVPWRSPLGLYAAVLPVALWGSGSLGALNVQTFSASISPYLRILWI